MHCKGYYKRNSLSRHVKRCSANSNSTNVTSRDRILSKSLVYSACQNKNGNMLNKLMVKEKIFSRMKADMITEAVTEDLLLIMYGEDLLKRNNGKRSLYHVSNKLRECGKFLLEMRQKGTYRDMFSILKPEHFDAAIEAVKTMSKYNTEHRSFGAPSLALHFGTTLKKSDFAATLVLRRKLPLLVHDIENELTNLKRFREMVDTQYTTELGSLALKDLNQKSATRPKLLPITGDIMKLKSFVENMAQEAYDILSVTSKDISEYRRLVESVLVSIILHNRKRVGDIQYLEVNSYKEQIHDNEKCTVQTEMCSSLTENEKILTSNYKRIISIGKGSRSVTILIPKNLQKYFTLVEELRGNGIWFPPENLYLFTYPHSMKWIDGCSVLRKYAKLSGAKNPELLTSSRLRKHIATVTQVLSLRRNEIDQLAKFMGHTTKTHEEFYKYV